MVLLSNRNPYQKLLAYAFYCCLPFCFTAPKTPSPKILPKIVKGSGTAKESTWLATLKSAGVAPFKVIKVLKSNSPCDKLAVDLPDQYK
jgi:hypothetical protein